MMKSKVYCIFETRCTYNIRVEFSSGCWKQARRPLAAICSAFFSSIFFNFNDPIPVRPIISKSIAVGGVVSGVRQWTKLTHVGPGYNWDGWPSSGGYTISGCNQPTRSTQPCIPPGSLNRVPASAGVKAGMSPLPGDPIWHVSSRSGEAGVLRT